MGVTANGGASVRCGAGGLEIVGCRWLAVAVVAGTAGRVAENLVGLGDLPEPDGGVGVFGVGVGMEAVGQAAVGAADLLGGSLRRHVEPPVHPIAIAGVRWHNLSRLLQIFDG